LDKVEIIRPKVGKVSVQNPLLGYTFQDGETESFPNQVGQKDFTKYKTRHTLRHPKGDKSQPDELVK
jgi:hypothetical protein